MENSGTCHLRPIVGIWPRGMGAASAFRTLRRSRPVRRVLGKRVLNGRLYTRDLWILRGFGDLLGLPLA